MKSTSKVIALLIITALSAVSSLDLNLVRRRRDGDTKIDPDTLKTDNAIMEKAVKQTKAARALLYKPNDVALTQLKIAADRLKPFVQLVDAWDQVDTTLKPANKADLAKVDTNKVSVWNHFLFNRQLEGGQLGKDTKKNDQLSIIGRISNKNGTGYDHAAFLALVGDIGTAIGDYSVKQPKDDIEEKKKFEVYAQIFGQFKNTASLSTVPKKDEALKLIAKVLYDQRSGDTITSNNKKKERGLVFNTDKSVKLEPARSGVFDCNKDKKIDKELGFKDDSKELIPPTKWPYQTVEKATIDKCAKEPWAGHYSGSINEVLMVLDLLIYTSSNDENLAHPLLSFELSKEETDKFTAIQGFTLPDFKSPNLNDAKREARAALAAAFLVGGGYHTANEVHFTVKKYLDKDKKLAGKKVAECDDTSTDKVSALFAKYTKS